MRTPHALLATTVTTAALAAAVVAPAPAEAADTVPPPGAYYVQSATTGLNAAGTTGTVEQRRPRGDEDHQRWNLRADGASHLLENTDSPGTCLGRDGDGARTVGCANPEARWDIAPAGADRFTIAAPGTGRRLCGSGRHDGRGQRGGRDGRGEQGVGGAHTGCPSSGGRPAHTRCAGPARVGQVHDTMTGRRTSAVQVAAG